MVREREKKIIEIRFFFFFSWLTVGSNFFQVSFIYIKMGGNRRIIYILMGKCVAFSFNDKFLKKLMVSFFKEN